MCHTYLMFGILKEMESADGLSLLPRIVLSYVVWKWYSLVYFMQNACNGTTLSP